MARSRKNLDPNRFMRYPLRRCSFLNFCELCRCDISSGQTYYDGGYGRRAHEVCVARPEPYRNEVSDGTDDTR